MLQKPILTKKAVISFQIAHGIISSSLSSTAGLVGPKTTSVMNDIIAGLNANTAPTAPTSPATVPALTTFTRDLQLGDTGSDVLALQQYLNTHGFIVAKIGAGSPGHETTTFGSATQVALVKFQKAHGIAPASGFFGPMTRGEVNASVK